MVYYPLGSPYERDYGRDAPPRSGLAIMTFLNTKAEEANIWGHTQLEYLDI